MRITIVGAGLMGRWHAYYARRAGATVAAVVDARSDAATGLARQCGGAAVFNDLDTALKEVETEAVHICTPLPSHASLAEAALRAGRHVMMEKPLTPDLGQTLALLELAKEHNRLLVPVHQFPFQSGFRSLTNHRGLLGDLVRVEFHTCSAGGEGQAPQRRREIQWEILPHPFSLMRRLLGRDLSDLPWKAIYSDEDELNLAAACGRTHLSITISLRGRPTRNELSVIGTGGSASLDLFHGFCLWEMGGAGRMSKALRPMLRGAGLLTRSLLNLGERALRRQPAYPGLFELMVGFQRAIDYNAPCPIPPDESADVARCLEPGRTTVARDV
jgi:predicted dehydrogenase